MVNHDRMPDPIEASYAGWTADSVIQLCNVPWNNDYRDIVDFKTEALKKSYFDNLPAATQTRIAKVSYARIDRPVRLQVPFSKAVNYNYIRVQNPAQNGVFNDAQTFYYFISGIDYSNPGVTTFMVQLDVWVTFGLRMTLGQCYVERGHIGIANQNQFSGYGRDFLTIPEGLDLGGEYQTVHFVQKEIMRIDTKNNTVPTNYNIMIATTIDMESDHGTISNPKLPTARGDNLQGLPSGASYYFFKTITDFQKFMEIYSNYPWVTQGVISISMVPDITKYGFGLVRANTVNKEVQLFKYSGPTSSAGNVGYGWRQDNLLMDWRESPYVKSAIPDKYKTLKKFFTYPYMVLELTTFSGQPITLKPESWQAREASIMTKIVFGAPNQKAIFYPTAYNTPNYGEAPNTNGPNGEHYGDYMDTMTQVTDFPTFSLVNNGYLSFMASNANGIAQQYKSADWSQNKALRGNDVSYDQSSNTMQAGANSAAITRNAASAQNSQANQNAWNQAIVGGIGGVANGIGGGPAGVAGAVASGGMGVAGTIVGNANRDAMTGISNQANSDQTANSLGNSAYLRDTNKSLADFAAKGDYQNNVASINAKVQDAHLIQPSSSGQQGGDTLNLVHGGVNLSLRFKFISANAIATIGDYWLRYGYAVQRFMTVPKISVMTKFTYWKLTESYLIGTYIPEVYKQSLRGIFEKGVTVWSKPEYIGVTDISDNVALPGIVIPVTPQPAPIVPVPEPLNPNDDEEDIMYLIQTNTLYWALGKEYLARLDTVNSGITIPSKLVGIPPINMSDDEFSAALSMCHVPINYVNPQQFLDENPSGVYSKDQKNADDIAVLKDGQASIMESINALAELIANPNPGTDPS